MPSTLSFLVPCYDAMPYLEEALESFFVTSKGYEERTEIVFVVEPKIGDKTGEYLLEKAKGDPRIKVIFNEKRLGAMANRLKALGAAKGDYVAFLDSDDLLDPSFCPRVFSLIDKENPDAISFGYALYKNGKKQWIPSPFSFKGDGHRLLKACLTDILTRCFLFTKVIRKSLFAIDDIPILLLGEDMVALAAVLPKAKKCIGISDALYLYRLDNSSSLTHKKDPDRYQKHAEAYASIREYYRRHDMKEEEKLFLDLGLRHRLSLLYDLYRARKDGMGKAQEREVKGLIKATLSKDPKAMDCFTQRYDSIPKSGAFLHEGETKVEQ